MTSSVDSWFDNLSEEAKKPLIELRKLILASSKNIQEDFKWSRPCYIQNHLVCYLQESKNHVTIGFQQGSQLDDPDSLLEGEGKDMRHVKVGFQENINLHAIRRLIDCAIEIDLKSN